MPRADLGCVSRRLVPGFEIDGLDAAIAAAVADHGPEPAIGDGLEALEADAAARYGRSFADLAAAEQDALLTTVAGAPWFRALAELAAEAVYANPANGGNRDAAAWAAIGYDHGLPEGPDGPPRRTLSAPPPPDLADAYDVIVVGAGAGGGVAASVLAEGGRRVLVLERGLARTYADSGHRDHLRNHRLPLYGHNTGPGLAENPRVAVAPDGSETVVPPNDPRYHNNAACVGSGTFVYGGLAWRFHPDDFRMASRYGVPEGSSLADWPFGYDAMEPWYRRAEWEIGVAGDARGSTPERGGYRYPMPPFPERTFAGFLRQGAERLGVATFAPPLLINSVPRNGRGACISCGSCVGFPCPSDAKNGTWNTAIPRALATGNCTLVTGAMVRRVETDGAGRVVGVSAFLPGESAPRTLRAKAVVLSAGAIETARLLLNSASEKEPQGLGNRHDQVGRHLQGHLYPTVFGLFDADVHDGRGPGVTIATTAYVHGNQGIVGGAMLADDFVMPPVIFWRQALPPDLPRWGSAAHDFMRENFRRVGQVKGPVHEIPTPESRVTVAAGTRDAWGIPVARLSGLVHEETMRSVAFVTARADDWLRASGAERTWHTPIARRLSAGQHQSGTCRMGDDPATSVTDPDGRVWGHDNLYVCDAAVHPNNSGFNPVLTILALSLRNATAVLNGL